MNLRSKVDVLSGIALVIGIIGICWPGGANLLLVLAAVVLFLGALLGVEMVKVV